MMCGMGLTSCIKTAYQPRNGCRTVIHLIYYDVNNPLMLRERTLVATMHEDHWTRITQEQFIAELAYCITMEHLYDSLSTLQSVSIPLETFRSNHIDTYKEGWLLARDRLNIVDTDRLDGVLVLEHIEQLHGGDKRAINSLMRRLCESREKAILYNSRLRAWMAIPYFDTKHIICLPGSFNPLHEGHIRMIRAAYKYLRAERDILEEDMSAIFEIALQRFGKSNDNITSFTSNELDHRLKEFNKLGLNIMLSESLLFEDKITLLHEKVKDFQLSKSYIWFVIGTDTIERIIDCISKSSSSVEAIDGLCGPIDTLNVRFLICPRGDDDVNVLLDKFAMQSGVYAEFRNKCIVLKERYFSKINLSSSDIRKDRQEAISRNSHIES